MKKILQVITEVEVTIDDDKVEQMLKDYRECIDSEANVNSLFNQIAFEAATWSGCQHIEGIGYKGTDGFNYEILGHEIE